MDYPIWDIGIGGGLLMALVAIPHVIVAHFAVGGGLLIAVSETLSVKRQDPEMRGLARRSSLMLVLVSTVFGAISGVGIWVVAGLISPGAISALIHNFVWGWATEWVFFILEIVAALVYYSTWDKISKGAHLMVGWLYFIGAFMSLVIINGIITFQLTPGAWLQDHAFWSGFFNPTFLPATVLRTGVALLMATVFMVFMLPKEFGPERSRLTRYLGLWLIGGTLIAYGGYRWWEAVLPENVLHLFRGAEPLILSLATTRRLGLWALALCLVIGLVLMLLLPKGLRTVSAVILALAAFTFFGSYERLREGVRKPFLIHGYMFSNGLRLDQIEDYNLKGVASHVGWVQAAGSEPEALGRAIFRHECASCHTLGGYLSIREALPTVEELIRVSADEPKGSSADVFKNQCLACHRDMTAEDMREALPSPEEIREDPESMQGLIDGMVNASLYELKEMGDVYIEASDGGNLDYDALSKPYMPPFVGTDDELEALSNYLVSLNHEKGGTR